MIGETFSMLFKEVGNGVKVARTTAKNTIERERVKKQSIEDEKNEILSRERWAVEKEAGLERGAFPINYGESQVDFNDRYGDFRNSVGAYNLINQKIQKKSVEVALYALYYDKSVRQAMKEIEEKHGYMPIEILKSIPNVVRKKMIELINPEQITKDMVGMTDSSIGADRGQDISELLFTEYHRDGRFSFHGDTLDSTHYTYGDSKNLVKALDICIEEMHKVSEKQRERIAAGETLNDEEDLTSMFEFER